ncbi:hypothetical protein SAMN05216490_2221 [Mucilaginibacter mallensis]|uniref:Uncharacterized protein n=1 Tax=Mucilaginibacter mallensis TaxID=652787 RepID=A0A1H1WL52_MUCMA|nr:hypothetical protein [Mucilaginibacter mallensis]SDS97883.1 hypothetical protein SAMN05216490_2221 [Mucilaginibacter mallensis]
MSSYRDWIVTDIRKKDDEKIKEVICHGDAIIEIISQEGNSLIVGVVTNDPVSSINLYNLYNDEPKPDFVIAKGMTVWTGDAINYARQNHIGWGGLGEMYSAIDNSDVSSVQKKEYKFVELGLKNHSKVSHLERLYDRIFKIHRTGHLQPLIITLINSYELTAEEIRKASNTYGSFDIVLITNPNGNTTGRAEMVAEELSAEILKWGELLGRLNKK